MQDIGKIQENYEDSDLTEKITQRIENNRSIVKEWLRNYPEDETHSPETKTPRNYASTNSDIRLIRPAR